MSSKPAGGGLRELRERTGGIFWVMGGCVSWCQWWRMRGFDYLARILEPCVRLARGSGS